MNRISISLILLIVISMVLPTSAFMYASGQSTTSDNNAADSGSSSGGGGSTTENSNSSTGGGGSTTENSGSSSSGGTIDNSGLSTGGSITTNNNAAGSSSNGSTASNNTGNTQGIDFKGILAVHNQERAAVGVPHLTWSDSLATSAQTWADQLLATGELEHSTCCGAFKDYGENLAYAGPPGYKTQPRLAQSWADEKKDYVPCNPCDYSKTGHYTQMVWKDTKQVGCGFASGPGGAYAKYGGTDILVCQYTPPGNSNSQPPF
jgi:hypothetical protein